MNLWNKIFYKKNLKEFNELEKKWITQGLNSKEIQRCKRF